MFDEDQVRAKCGSKDKCTYPACACTPTLVLTINAQGNQTSTRLNFYSADFAEGLRLLTTARDALSAEILDAKKCPFHAVRG